MRNFLHAIKLSNLVERVDARGQATVQTEDLVFNYSRQRQVVEKFSEVFPNVGIAVLAQALVVEAIHLRDLSAFVVAAKNRQSVFEAHFQSYEQSHSLH